MSDVAAYDVFVCALFQQVTVKCLLPLLYQILNVLQEIFQNGVK